MTALVDAALRRIDQAEAHLRLLVRNVAYLATVARSSPTGEGDTAHGPDRDEGGRIPFRRVSPFGLHSVPPEGTLVAIVKALAGKAAGLGVGFVASRYAPSDLETGESALYSSANPKAVHADKDGNTRIAGSGGADVVVNGGTAKVARAGDPVNRTGTFALWVAAVRTNIVNAGGADPGDCPVQIGTIDGGADHFKA